MVLEFNNVELKQNDQLILTDVNFSVNNGEFVFVTGKVGSGKSTLLSAIYGELVPSSGNANVLGYDMTTVKHRQITELRKRLGIVFQSFELLQDRTVYANLSFVLKATGWKNRQEIDQRIHEVLSKVELLDKEESFPFELSGGEQQRMAIARAMLNKPELIIADEPTGNLDIDSSYSIMELLKEICHDGTAVVMSTHNLKLIDLVEGAKVFSCADKHLEETLPQPNEENL